MPIIIGNSQSNNGNSQTNNGNSNNGNSNNGNGNSYYYPEPTEENLANAREYAEDERRYREPIFGALYKVQEQEDQFRGAPHINNLMDLFEALENYKRVIPHSDLYDVRETYLQIEEIYNLLIDDVAGSTNTNVSGKSNYFSNLMAEIDHAYHAARQRGGHRKRKTRKHHTKKSTKRKHGKSRKSSKKH